MQGGSDDVARGARVVRLDRAFRWPGGRHLAVVLNLAYEGWSDGKTAPIFDGPLVGCALATAAGPSQLQCISHRLSTFNLL